MLKILIIVAVVILTLVLFLAWGNHRFEKKFRNDVTQNLSGNIPVNKEMLTEKDLAHLPEPVQKYLRYVGVVNKPRVYNFYVEMDGQMRSKTQDYFPFTCEQYDFMPQPARLFFMKGKMKGIKVPGYHHYEKAKASMDIRLFGLFPLIQKSGEAMNKAETVTLLNDICIMAPAALIDNRISWEEIDSLSAKAIFTNEGISVSAILSFNTEGQMINFLSYDRIEVNEMKAYPFSTPMTEYGEFNGYRLCSFGEAVWRYEDGEFTYGRFFIRKVAYNVAK